FRFALQRSGSSPEPFNCRSVNTPPISSGPPLLPQSGVQGNRVLYNGIYTPCPKRGSGRRRRSAVSGHEIHFPSLRPRSIPLPRPTPVCLRNPPHLGKIGPVTTAYRREQS